MYEPTQDELMFFNQYPDMLPVYLSIMEWLTTEHERVTASVKKTMISLRAKYVFAGVSLPWRRSRGWPERFLQLSVGLSRQRLSPRVKISCEPYPNRWTHHILLESERDFDDEIRDFLEEAYDFSQRK